jgi:serine/threonine-protein kinase
MERLTGPTLADEIARGPMPVLQVRRILDEVLAALAVAHSAGILHRDIKPGNILFAASGEAKVTDFGIAKTADGDPTVTGQIVGTMAYLSPDRITGRSATTSDDMYAVGVVGWEALAGRGPFPQQNPGALVHAILSEPPPPIAAVRPDVDPVLAGVIVRAMARDERLRFTSAPAMRAALTGAGQRATAWPAPPPPPMRPPTQVLAAPVPDPTFAAPLYREQGRFTRSKTLLGLGAVLAVLLLAAVLLMFDSPSAPPEPVTTSTVVPSPTSSGPATTTPSPSPTQPINLPPSKRKGDKGNGNGRDHGD